MALIVAATVGCSLTGLSDANAGFIEIGGSGSYRRSIIDADSSDESRSISGSLGYYLNEASAIELSYTDGLTKRSLAADKPNGHITKMSYQTLGLDFVYTIGSRESTFRPYVKIGANYILQKRIVDQYRDASGNLFEANVYEDTPGMVPSAGFGFRLGLTESLAFKAGVDAWTSRSTNITPVTVDYVVNCGLSLMF